MNTLSSAFFTGFSYCREEQKMVRENITKIYTNIETVQDKKLQKSWKHNLDSALNSQAPILEHVVQDEELP